MLDRRASRPHSSVACNCVRGGPTAWPPAALHRYSDNWSYQLASIEGSATNELIDPVTPIQGTRMRPSSAFTRAGRPSHCARRAPARSSRPRIRHRPRRPRRTPRSALRRAPTPRRPRIRRVDGRSVRVVARRQRRRQRPACPTPTRGPTRRVVTADAKTRNGLFKVHRINNRLLFEIPRKELGGTSCW